ncbi:MAG TPA: Mur ligase family protein, partial [Bacteroidales bacterium]|nr:Mur ligase family protein [Bacteroidales bacterium]
MLYTAQEIASVLNAGLIGDPLVSIQNIVLDSRTLTSPEFSLFVAIKGERHDGHIFINDLFQRGVRCFLVHRTFTAFEKEATYLVVDDTLSAFQGLAAWHRKRFSIPVIGITGSNGKTITKEWIYQSLHNEVNVVRSPKSFNSQVGVPLSALLIESQHQLAVLEAGISKRGEMEKLETIVQPTIGIITNIGEPHQENFSDLKEKASEKMKLFKNCKSVVYCKDHLIIDELVRTEYKFLEQYAWSRTKPAFLEVKAVTPKENSTQIDCFCKNEKVALTIPFIDNASIENALHVATLLFHLDYSADFIKSALQNIAPVAMRLELKQGVNHSTLINDSYNSDLGSLSVALDFLVNQRQHNTKTVILSDILQSGQKGEVLYTQVASLIRNKHISHFIGIGEEISKYKDLFDSGSEFYGHTDEF